MVKATSPRSSFCFLYYLHLIEFKNLNSLVPIRFYRSLKIQKLPITLKINNLAKGLNPPHIYESKFTI